MNLLAADETLRRLFGIVLGLLVAGTLIGLILARIVRTEPGRRTVANMNVRIGTWWALVAIWGLALLLGEGGIVALFFVLSFLALREFITFTHTHSADHRAVFWTFFAFTPLQYYLVAIQWYGMFSILIPVYAFLFIPMRNAVEGDTKHFLEPHC